MPHALSPLIFPALMAFAASYDCLSMKISNRLCLIVAASFAPAAIGAGLDAHQIVLHLACGAAMLGVGFGLFTMRWIGGGDAKLFGSAALWFGWEQIVSFGMAVAIAGGVLALAILAFRVLINSYPMLAVWPLQPKSELPYGVALAAGALLVYPQSIWMNGVVS